MAPGTTTMSYVPDPSTRDTPLTLEEVEELARANGAPVAKARLAGHFVSRVLATIRMNQEMLNRLHREVAIMQTKRAYEGGVATTLAPRDAVKFLSPQERADLTDETTRLYLERLGRAASELDAARSEMSRAVAAANLALASALEDPAVPAEVRARLAELATRVPDQQWTGRATAAADTAAVAAAPLLTDAGMAPPTTSAPAGTPPVGAPLVAPPPAVAAPSPEPVGPGAPTGTDLDDLFAADPPAPPDPPAPTSEPAPDGPAPSVPASPWGAMPVPAAPPPTPAAPSPAPADGQWGQPVAPAGATGPAPATTDGWQPAPSAPADLGSIFDDPDEVTP